MQLRRAQVSDAAALAAFAARTFAETFGPDKRPVDGRKSAPHPSLSC
jgi:hypothetical protein